MFWGEGYARSFSDPTLHPSAPTIPNFWMRHCHCVVYKSWSRLYLNMHCTKKKSRESLSAVYSFIPYLHYHKQANHIFYIVCFSLFIIQYKCLWYICCSLGYVRLISVTVFYVETVYMFAGTYDMCFKPLFVYLLHYLHAWF